MGNNLRSSKGFFSIERQTDTKDTQKTVELKNWKNSSREDLQRNTFRRRSQRRTSVQRQYSESKTAWPLRRSDSIFLPEFECKPALGFEDFQILENIGKGAFGHIVKVKRKDTDEIFAMKVLNKSEIIQEDAVKQCRDEVSVQNKLRDFPFVVKSKFSWQTKHNLYIVSDFIPYGDLYSLWEEQRIFSEDSVRVYILELSLTLDFLHKSGVIYRDLKLENILLDDRGHIQLIDFGLAKWLGLGERAWTICGTLQYMAPEILRGRAYTHSVDWWSLGIVMYMLLLGRFPFTRSRNHREMYRIVTKMEPEIPRSVSASAKNLIKRFLDKDPRQRLAHIDVVKKHPFFKKIHSEDVLKKKVDPLDDIMQAKLDEIKVSQIRRSRNYSYTNVSFRDIKRRPFSWASMDNFQVDSWKNIASQQQHLGGAVSIPNF